MSCSIAALTAAIAKPIAMNGAAAASAGAKEGVFSPAQLAAAVRNDAGRGALGKGQYSEGRALMQDLSDDAVNVLGPKYPDSGTAGRSALHSIPAMVASVIGLAPAAIYTPAGQKAVVAALAKRPEMVRLLGEELKKLAPMAAATGSGGVLANGQQ